MQILRFGVVVGERTEPHGMHRSGSRSDAGPVFKIVIGLVKRAVCRQARGHRMGQYHLFAPKWRDMPQADRISAQAQRVEIPGRGGRRQQRNHVETARRHRIRLHARCREHRFRAGSEKDRKPGSAAQIDRLDETFQCISQRLGARCSAQIPQTFDGRLRQLPQRGFARTPRGPGMRVGHLQRHARSLHMH